MKGEQRRWRKEEGMRLPQWDGLADTGAGSCTKDSSVLVLGEPRHWKRWMAADEARPGTLLIHGKPTEVDGMPFQSIQSGNQ